MLAKSIQRGLPPGVQDEVKPCALAKRWPCLFDFVAADWWSETEARVPGKLHVWKEEGVLKICLVDRDTPRVLFLTGRTLEELFDVANAALGDPGADWRPDRKAASAPVVKPANSLANGKRKR
jgi:hypothetical protein